MCVSVVLCIEDMLSLHSPNFPSLFYISLRMRSDGNNKGGANNFPLLARAAVQHGWMVEIWAWSISLSGSLREVAKEYPALVKIVDMHLDKHLDHISTVHNPGRMVHHLDIPKHA